MTSNIIQGVGVSLRQPHYAEFLGEHPPAISWLEIMTDNYMFTQGLLREKLFAIRARYPMVMHGVSLNIGSIDPLNIDYLTTVKKLADDIQPAWISDHLCWTAIDGQYSHDLLPLPYTEETLQHVVQRIDQVQFFLRRPFIIENVSSYLQSEQADFSEAEFLNAVAKHSGCGILLDINNIYVSATNHGFAVTDYLQAISPEYVQQFHLAGYAKQGELLVDTHGSQVSEPVWQLFAAALTRFGAVPSNIEWDNNIPNWNGMLAEIKRAREIFDVQCPSPLQGKM